MPEQIFFAEIGVYNFRKVKRKAFYLLFAFAKSLFGVLFLCYN